MGKVYEDSTLLAYAKDRVEAYKAFDEQLDVLKKALHAVATLDHEFQGKGADSIKDFYASQVDMVTHWKSLVSSHQSYFNSIADYAEQAKLKGDTVVDVSFLEQELAVANDRSKQMVEQQHTELEAILSNIEDIIHITPFPTEAFEDELSAAEKKRTETITAVEELDNQLSSEYDMLNPFYESVQFNVNSLEQLTSQGGSAYQLAFDAKAYKNSDAYKTQQQIDKGASGYVEGKAEQKQEIKERKAAIEAERQRQIQANKPWYEKGLDIAGELTGYYDYKRAVEGVDPVTHTKLSTTQRVTAGAMAAAGFIPFVGWAGRAVKGASVVYKTAKSMSAAHHAMALYQTPKAFKALEQTEKGLYGLVLTNGMYEYTTGKDVLGNKLTKKQQQASLFQSFGIAAGGVLASKASTQLVEKGAQTVTKKFNDMRNVVRTTKVTKYGKDIQRAMRNMPAVGVDKAKKMYDAVLDAKVPRFLPQEAPVGVSVDFAQQTVRDVLKSTAKDTMHFIGKESFDGKRWRDGNGRFIKEPNGVSKVEKRKVDSFKKSTVDLSVDKQHLHLDRCVTNNKESFDIPRWSNDGKYDQIRGYKGRDLTDYDIEYLVDPRLVVEMNFKGKGNAGTNAAGWERNAKKFFNTLLKSNPEFWSPENTAMIKRGRVPVVDKQFIEYFPQYGDYIKDSMRHHHIGEGGQAAALPKSLHPGYGGIHNVEKEWGITGIDDKIANRLENFVNNSGR
ncbi:T7SS effector LXG polymorphic toxin [Priestia megaterium]|uniref:T7SS effector LXG polymorphic toxin n=1 Tax=Priestia megaterium TaxID=1404 RepID=UPI001F46DE2E|nr:T7SS effector LXG polymorphic toxin [Priestia megaterium]MCF8889778.1 pre-toxin TG domain-containing protein [Priestia megaterium]